MRFDPVIDNFDYFLWGAFPKGPLGGLAMTILLAAVSIFLAFWVGLVFGLMRNSKNRIIRYIAMIYIEVVRGTPLLLLIFWFYFLAPVIVGYSVPELQTTVVALVVFTGAYIAEIVRAGIQALPKGQMEAARGSGLSHVQAMRFVILPQSLRNMIPSFVNQFVSLTKDTSLASTIGVLELTRCAEQVSNRTLTAPMEIYLTILVMYFLICYVLTSYSRKLEKQLSRYQARDR